MSIEDEAPGQADHRSAATGDDPAAREPAAEVADDDRGVDGDTGSAGDDATELPGPTGDTRVDTALERLREIDGRPPAEHVEVYDDVHRRLQDALADLDGS